MERETLETFEDFKGRILSTKARGGQYWTNIEGCELRIAADKLGRDEANRLIRECRLEKDGWQGES